MEKLLRELNPVFKMLSDFHHLFGGRYEIILKYRENWNKPEECLSEYADVFYINGSKTGQDSVAMIFQAKVYAILRVVD